MIRKKVMKEDKEKKNNKKHPLVFLKMEMRLC